MSKCDSLFELLQKSITKSMSRFAATIFLLISFGILYTLFFVYYNLSYWFLLGPPFISLLAYYDRTAAVLGIILFIIIFFF